MTELEWPVDMPIYMDADACPVKEEVYRVARRYEIKVYVVANSPLRVPAEDLIELVVVKGGFDAADDWIAERVRARRYRDHGRHPASRSLPEARCSRFRSQGA